ncbi:MAG: ATP-binding cassette domain-containing protein [Prevotella sp.]|jgi:cell division transport system ATP-binding protein|nr:ATP-binding cassette domain-containing protein [Prevotella sp.]
MLINYKNANIYHKDGDTVLRGVNFHVDEGEFIYLIGRVGSGKSSLLKTIYCEMDIDEADEALVLGFDLLSLRRKQIPELRRKMGIIFQDLQLLSDRSVYHNLLFVLKATGWRDKNDINGRIDEVLEQVGMTDKKDRMPHELSGGEQQHINIARALLNSPKLIVADEPTASLDNETAENIIRLLREISLQGTAVILTTHNRSLLNKYPGIVYRCNEQMLDDVTNDYNHMQLSEEELDD